MSVKFSLNSQEKPNKFRWLPQFEFENKLLNELFLKILNKFNSLN